MPNNTNQPMPRGAKPSPQSDIDAAPKHVPDPSVPIGPEILMWPTQLSYWGNNIYGDCVTAEEGFAKATAKTPSQPQVFVPETTVVQWATADNYLNGATISSVLRSMLTGGFKIGLRRYNNGMYSWVNWKDPATLHSAISTYGPVKLGVGAETFETNANGRVTPGASGWAMYNYQRGSFEDHCVSLCGYGTLAQMVAGFKEHGVTVSVPAGMPTTLCYAMFTWNSLGIIDEQSMLTMTDEAWVRKPVTTFI